MLIITRFSNIQGANAPPYLLPCNPPPLPTSLQHLSVYLFYRPMILTKYFLIFIVTSRPRDRPTCGTTPDPLPPYLPPPPKKKPGRLTTFMTICYYNSPTFIGLLIPISPQITSMLEHLCCLQIRYNVTYVTCIHRYFPIIKVNFNGPFPIKFSKDRGQFYTQETYHDDVVSIFNKAVMLMDVMNCTIA